MREWGAEPLTDLRAALATAERGTVVLIADPGQFGAPSPRGVSSDSTRLDVEELDTAHERGVKIVSLEPLPAALTQLAGAGVKVASGGSGGASSHNGGEWATLAPLSRYRRPLRKLRELLPSLGHARTLSIQTLGTPAHGSLGARLFDAADIAITLLGQPESVHAVFTTPQVTRGVHAAPPAPDHLRGLDGDLTATLRYDGNRSATITASNRAAHPSLCLTLLAAEASATVTDDRLTVSHTREHAGDRDAPYPDPERAFAEALATQLSGYLASGVGLAGEVDFAATLALAQAALLSARTGEPESPAIMLKLAGL
ncbi:MAG: hypothetical protein QM783_04450 [Phycisphaerales bacterium]